MRVVNYHHGHGDRQFPGVFLMFSKSHTCMACSLCGKRNQSGRTMCMDNLEIVYEDEDSTHNHNSRSSCQWPSLINHGS